MFGYKRMMAERVSRISISEEAKLVMLELAKRGGQRADAFSLMRALKRKPSAVADTLSVLHVQDLVYVPQISVFFLWGDLMGWDRSAHILGKFHLQALGSDTDLKNGYDQRFAEPGALGYASHYMSYFLKSPKVALTPTGRAFVKAQKAALG